MTRSLQCYFRQLPATQKVNRLPLANCLRRLGVKPATGYWFKLSSMSVYQLLDVFHAAHMKFREMMSKVHTDIGGSQEACSRLTELWARIKFLFKRKGIMA
jgi:hypothetical protein